MEVCDMSACVARRRHDSKHPFDNFSVGHQVVRCYCLRRGFFQQSAQQDQNTFFRDMFTEPATNAAGRSCPR